MYGGDGSCDSFRSPCIQQAKFKRAGSGDLFYFQTSNNIIPTNQTSESQLLK